MAEYIIPEHLRHWLDTNYRWNFRQGNKGHSMFGKVWSEEFFEKIKKETRKNNMENLEELKKKYEELGKEIERLENAENGGRFKEGSNYYYIDDEGDITDDSDYRYCSDSYRFEIGNYFKTREEAEKAVEKIKIYNKLKRLADRLNMNYPIDWNDEFQQKYNIELYVKGNRIEGNNNTLYKKQGVIYCTDGNFSRIAIREIGEEELKKLFED